MAEDNSPSSFFFQNTYKLQLCVLMPLNFAALTLSRFVKNKLERSMLYALLLLLLLFLFCFVLFCCFFLEDVASTHDLNTQASIKTSIFHFYC
jgi:hypothetical protein